MIDLAKIIDLNNNGKLAGQLLKDVPNEVYHHPECPGISKSGLDLVHRSYNHYLEGKKKKKGEEKSKALIFGSAVHDAVLEPDTFHDRYVVKPEINRRTKEGKASYEKFVKESYGKDILSQDELDTIREMKAKVLAHPTASKMLHGSLKEMSGWFDDGMTLCKFRADVYKPGTFIADLKTTQDASPSAFRKSVAQYSYDKQAAFYQKGLELITGQSLPFYFIAVEKTPPYGIAVYKIDEASLEVGRELVKRDLQKYVRALMFGDEKGYPEGTQDLSLPAWGFDVANR